MSFPFRPFCVEALSRGSRHPPASKSSLRLYRCPISNAPYHTSTLSPTNSPRLYTCRRPFNTSLVRYDHYSTKHDDLKHLHHLSSTKDHALARTWLDGFKVDDIPKESLEITRSRSSGPGGQHVNKTESKVTIRLNLLHAQERWLPPFVLAALESSPHYHSSSPPSLLLSSQTSRSASHNQTTALHLLYTTIRSAAESLIVNPTSPEQRARVRGLEKREKERRLEGKKRHGAKKAARRDID
ncbi:hypothetical protein IAR55_000042 [Kwoniella newhampshirensis]|uniref:Prokaryotic-type class I peptide chain release factors domain-containing protein n=1 Tax=Kwoniella newhampshirensis TaxID=1651941 RepID=A0AAW0Z5J4_9TREE